MTTVLLSKEDVMAKIPDRKPDSHKGDYGKILLLCGSVGYTGAAALAAMGALRSGAGLVYLGVPERIYPIMAGKMLEPVVFPLDDQNGMLSDGAIAELSKLLPRMDAVLMGCGLGLSKGTLEVLRYVLETFQGPVVLDADGITMVAGHKDLLRGRKGATVLTPHEGEFKRLMPMDEDRYSAAKALAVDLGVVVVLKGHMTVITDGIESYINPTGNPGMAVGGSGDVLAGVIVSLIGQGLSPLDAAACGVWLHGAAGDLCAGEIGQYGMLPSDMLSALPRLMK